MAASFGWRTLAASSLVIGSIVALVFRINLRTIGLIMGFGSGVLISAIAFDLVQEAVDQPIAAEEDQTAGEEAADDPAVTG